MPNPNPFDEMRRLVNRIGEVVKPLDLEVTNVSFNPEADGTNGLMVFFAINPNAVKSQLEIETGQTNDAFAEMMSQYDVEASEGSSSIVDAEPERTPEEQAALDRAEDVKERLRKQIEEDSKGDD